MVRYFGQGRAKLSVKENIFGPQSLISIAMHSAENTRKTVKVAGVKVESKISKLFTHLVMRLFVHKLRDVRLSINFC